MMNPTQNLPMRDMIAIIINSRHLRESKLIFYGDFYSLRMCAALTLVYNLSSGIRNIMIMDMGRPRIHHMSLMVRLYNKTSTWSHTEISYKAMIGPIICSFRILTYTCLCFLLSVLAAQDEWDNSWSSSGAGGKAPPSRQSKGGYREHPYRY